MTAKSKRPTEFLPLSQGEFQILLALGERPLHGYGIMKEVEDRCGPGAILGPGTLYGALKRLRQSGLIEDAPGRKGSRAAPYRITALGRDVATAESERHRTLLRWADSGGV